jgi:succinate dehydrogenase hydrophobic anchor subunit
MKIILLYNNFFDKLHFLDGLLHWNIQRFSAIFLCLSIVGFIFFDNLYIFLFIILLLAFHMSVGIQTLIDDYIHDHMLFLIVKTFLRFLCIFLLKTAIIVFVC